MILVPLQSKRIFVCLLKWFLHFTFSTSCDPLNLLLELAPEVPTHV
ncbi:unnamed protein product [Tenebrio molitor]|nr:unnamed protein product [Tenebrio molitor]